MSLVQPVEAPGNAADYARLIASGALIDLAGRPLRWEPCPDCNGERTSGMTCPMALTCRHCGAKPRAKCKRPSDHDAAQPHKSRYEDAEADNKRRAASGDLTVPAPWPGKEEPMTAATARRRRGAAIVHEMVTTERPGSRLLDVTCRCGEWSADAPASDALAPTIYREHTEKLAQADKATKKSTTGARKRGPARATKAQLTEVENLFSDLFNDDTADREEAYKAEFTRRLTALRELTKAGANVIDSVEATQVAPGTLVRLTGRLPGGQRDFSAPLAGYVLAAFPVVKNYQGWTTDECMVFHLAPSPEHLDGVPVQVEIGQLVDVLDPGVAGHAQRPTVEQLLADAGLKLGADEGPGVVSWRLPWQKEDEPRWDELERIFFSEGFSGPADHYRPVLKQRWVAKAIEDGVWPGKPETGPTPLRLVREGAYGSITGMLEGVERTVTGVFDRVWSASHGRQFETTANVVVRTGEGPGLRVLTVQVPADGAEFVLHAPGEEPEQPKPRRRGTSVPGPQLMPVVKHSRSSQRWSWACTVETCLVMRDSFATSRVAKWSWMQHCREQEGANHPANTIGTWPAEYWSDGLLPVGSEKVEYGEHHIAWIYKVGSAYAFECAEFHDGYPFVDVIGGHYDARSHAIMHARSAHQVPDPEIPTDDDLLPADPAKQNDPEGLCRRIYDEAHEVLSTATAKTDPKLVAWAAGAHVMTTTSDLARYEVGGRRPADLVSDFQGGSLDNHRFYDADRSSGLEVYKLNRVELAEGRDIQRETLFTVKWARVKKLLDQALDADPDLLRMVQQANWRRSRALRKTLAFTPERNLAEDTCAEVAAMVWDAARPAGKGAGRRASSARKAKSTSETSCKTAGPTPENRTAEPQLALFDLDAFLAEARASAV